MEHSLALIEASAKMDDAIEWFVDDGFTDDNILDRVKDTLRDLREDR